MKKILLLVLLLPIMASAQVPVYQIAGQTDFDLDWLVASADSAVQTNQIDTAWFTIVGSPATFYWRSFQYVRDTLFTAESLHVVMEHSPSQSGDWVVYDSTAILTTTDSSATGYLKHLARVELDSAYVGQYWRIRARRGKVAPTTTVFRDINGNTYNLTLRLWIERGYGND